MNSNSKFSIANSRRGRYSVCQNQTQDAPPLDLQAALNQIQLDNDFLDDITEDFSESSDASSIAPTPVKTNKAPIKRVEQIYKPVIPQSLDIAK